jgi:hypothetical protein
VGGGSHFGAWSDVDGVSGQDNQDVESRKSGAYFPWSVDRHA